jgi:hypothetical protein
MLGFEVPDEALVGADDEFPLAISVPVHNCRVGGVTPELQGLPVLVEEEGYGTLEDGVLVGADVKAEQDAALEECASILGTYAEYQIPFAIAVPIHDLYLGSTSSFSSLGSVHSSRLDGFAVLIPQLRGRLQTREVFAANSTVQD